MNALGLSVNIDPREAFLANPSRVPTEENGQQERAKVAAATQEERLSGVSLQKDSEGGIKLLNPDRDYVALSPSTISLKNASRPDNLRTAGMVDRALEEVKQFVKKTTTKFLELFEDAERRTYSPELLASKAGKFSKGIYQSILKRLGISQAELEKIAIQIRAELSQENYQKMCGTVKNDVLLKCTGLGVG